MNIVKTKYGLKVEKELLEHVLRPEFVEKMKLRQKGKNRKNPQLKDSESTDAASWKSARG